MHHVETWFSEPAELLAGQVDHLAEQHLSVWGDPVKEGRECTRDEAWQLLNVTIKGFGNSCSLFAECYGGDAVQINAPFDLHGSELTELLASTVQSDLAHGASFSFTCETILVRSQLL